MAKCPKCQRQLPWTKLVFLKYGGLTCPTCYVRLEPENVNFLGFISFILAAVCIEIFKATGYASYRSWSYIAIVWIALFVQVPLRCFFLRINIKGREDRLLNL